MTVPNTSTIIGGIITLALAIAGEEYRMRNARLESETFEQSCSIALQHIQGSSFDKQKLIDLAVERNKEMYEDLMECLQ